MHRLAGCSGFVAAALVASVLAAPAARAQLATRTATDSATLLRLEDSWAVALVKRDAKTFERLLSPGFVYTENDQMTSRAGVIHDVVAGTDTAKTARNEGMVVHLFDQTAIVTGWLIVTGRGKSGRFEHRYRFTDSWVKRGDDWQIVAAQDYLAPAKAR